LTQNFLLDTKPLGRKITDKWSIFGGLVLMKSEVTKSLIPSPQPLLYPTNVGLPPSNVAHQSLSVLTKYQLTDVWELGGQAVYRSKIYGGTFLAANQGTQIPGYWRFDACGGADRQELEGQAVREQPLQQDLLRRLVPERDAFHSRSAGTCGLHRGIGEILMAIRPLPVER
jgi:hypothetical protein